MLKILVLIILIISIVLSCISIFINREHFANNILNVNDCYNSGLDEEQLENCKRNMMVLSGNLNAQYQGQPANRGLTYPGGAYGGSFGNPEVIN